MNDSTFKFFFVVKDILQNFFLFTLLTDGTANVLKKLLDFSIQMTTVLAPKIPTYRHPSSSSCNGDIVD